MREEQAPGLRRELGVGDLTLFTIACIVSTRWPSVAAHAGPSSVTLWVLGAVFFVLPLAVAVATLTTKYPGAGGLYLWIRNDFGPWPGFLNFWIYWMGIAFLFPSVAMFYMSTSAYMLGPAYAHLADSRVFVLAGSLITIWIALGTNLIGLKIGKWTENLGGAATWVLGGLLVGAAAMAYAKRGAATSLTWMNVVPTWNWQMVNFWATIAFAMSGMEFAGMMGAEIRDPERTLPRAAAIASAFATVFYVSTTVALLTLLEPGKINEMQGLAQGGAVAGGELGAGWFSPLIAMLVLTTALGAFGGMGSAVSRLPFAAGVDHLLPAAFGKVHPRWSTPYISILVFGAVASFLLVAIQLGDTMRAAYQTLISLMVIVGFIPYLYIFGSAWKAGKQISALSGWAITVLVIVCSLAPTADVTNVWVFEGKLALGTLAVIVSAWLVYARRRK